MPYFRLRAAHVSSNTLSGCQIECRVKHLDTAAPDSIRRLDHVRICSLLATMLTLDVVCLSVFGLLTLERGVSWPCVVVVALVCCVVLTTLVSPSTPRQPSVLILFGFEYALMAITVLATFSRYVLYLIGRRYEGGRWHNRSLYSMLIEVCCELVRLAVYLLYFGIIFSFYGMPLPIIRDLWSACYPSL